MAGAIIQSTDNSARTCRGRKKADPRDLFDLAVQKLRTGVRWDSDDLGKGGTTAFKLHKTILASGHWEAIWRLIMADEGLSLSEPEKLAATEWQIKEGHLSGPMTAWFPPEPEPEQKPKQPKANKRLQPPLWEIPEELFDRIGPIIHGLCPPASTGRKRTDHRIVLNGILFQMRTGCQWKALRWHGCSYQTMHRWLMRWEKAGVFQSILETLIREAESMGLVNWAYMSMDGSLGKSRKGGEDCGPNPTDRKKGGIKRSLLVEGNGYPIAIVTAPANVPDLKLVKATLDARVRPSEAFTHIQTTLILDRGYRGQKVKDTIESEGLIYRAPPRGDDNPYHRLDIPLSKEERAVRATVERCHSWFVNYRACLVRYSFKKDSHLAILKFTAALMWWRRVNQKS